MLDVFTIAGSPSSSSRSAAVLEHVRRTLERRGLHTGLLRVRDLPPEDLVYGRIDSPAVAETAALLGQARGVIVATPVYKAAYSGVLKAFFDLLPQTALLDKLVLPIATGGSLAHLLAIDYTLRPVLTALGAQHILQGVYVVDSQVQLTDAGIQLDPELDVRLDSALSAFVQLLYPNGARVNGLHEHVA